MRRLDATCDFVEGESGSEFEKGEERGGGWCDGGLSVERREEWDEF